MSKYFRVNHIKFELMNFGGKNRRCSRGKSEGHWPEINETRQVHMNGKTIMDESCNVEWQRPSWMSHAMLNGKTIMDESCNVEWQDHHGWVMQCWMARLSWMSHAMLNDKTIMDESCNVELSKKSISMSCSRKWEWVCLRIWDNLWHREG